MPVLFLALPHLFVRTLALDTQLPVRLTVISIRFVRGVRNRFRNLLLIFITTPLALRLRRCRLIGQLFLVCLAEEKLLVCRKAFLEEGVVAV